MANVTARFQADFSTFSDAVAKAETELRSFETEAGKVQSALNRMVDSFSGRKVINDASLMASAVDRIGGVSRLTERELQTLIGKTDEAIAKMKAMGLVVPPEIQKIATEAKAAADKLKTVGDGAGDLAKIAGAAGTASSGLGGLLRAIGPIGGAMAGAFTIGAITGFTKDVIDLGGRLVDLRDKTGISVEGLQILQSAAELSGNTLDQVTGAVTQMQNRLASGDSSAVAAVQGLGLSLSDLQRMAPDEQFRALARGIADINDPARRAQMAIDLFGRAGAELLPTLVSDIDAVAASTVRMSTRSAEALDTVGDAWTRFAGNVKAQSGEFIADVIATITTLDGLKETAMRLSGNQVEASLSLEFRKAKDEALLMAQAIKAPAKDIAEPYKVGTGAITDFLNAGKQIPSVVKPVKDVGKEVEAVAAPLKTASVFTREIADSMKYLAVVQPPAVTGAQAFRNELAGVNANGTLVSALLPQLRVKLQDIGQKGFKSATTEAKSFADFMAADLPKSIMGAFQGGGDVSKSIGASIGGFLTGKDGVVGKMIGNISGSLGKMLNSVIPGLGSLIGGLGGELVGKVFGKLFKAEGKQVNDMRDALQSTFGSFDAMAQKAAGAGYEIKRLLDAKTVKDYKAEVDKLNGALKFQDDAMKTLDETVKKYGFSVEELGPAFARQELDKQAQGLWQDFQVLTSAGIDMDTVLGKMGGSINEFVASALRTGTEVPAAMAPMLQRMVEMGTLTDANGNQITDLEKSGVSFSMTMSQGFQSLIGEVGKLTEAIARGLGISLDDTTKKVTGEVGPALQTVADSAGKAVDVAKAKFDFLNLSSDATAEEIEMAQLRAAEAIRLEYGALADQGFLIPVEFQVGDLRLPDVPAVTIDPTVSTAARGGRVLADGVSYFARGGFVPKGTDTVPAMLTPGEIVLNQNQQKAVSALLDGRVQRPAAFLGDGGGDVYVEVVSVLDGREVARSVTTRQSRDLRTRRKVAAA